MIDAISYVMGKKAGEKTVEIDGSEYTFTDTNGDGAIVITPSEEVNNNG